jgi:hypothetical protein
VVYINDTGYPSTTNVIKPWVNTEWFTEEDRERGSAVHTAMKAHALGLWHPPLRKDWQPYFDSGRLWFDKVVKEVVLVEERLIDESRGYCGQPDLIAVLHADKYPSLIDYKTSQAKGKWWPLQIASYRRLAAVDRGIECKRGIGVRLRKDGSIAKATEYKEFPHHLNVFTGMMNAYNFFN